MNIRLQIKAWIDENTLETAYLSLNHIQVHNTSVMHPLLLNVALCGINFYLNFYFRYMDANGKDSFFLFNSIRYANSFIITHKSFPIIYKVEYILNG